MSTQDRLNAILGQLTLAASHVDDAVDVARAALSELGAAPTPGPTPDPVVPPVVEPPGPAPVAGAPPIPNSLSEYNATLRQWASWVNSLPEAQHLADVQEHSSAQNFRTLEAQAITALRNSANGRHYETYRQRVASFGVELDPWPQAMPGGGPRPRPGG